jgi:hypothetical protein
MQELAFLLYPYPRELQVKDSLDCVLALVPTLEEGTLDKLGETGYNVGQKTL